MDDCPKFIYEPPSKRQVFKALDDAIVETNEYGTTTVLFPNGVEFTFPHTIRSWDTEEYFAQLFYALGWADCRKHYKREGKLND